MVISASTRNNSRARQAIATAGLAGFCALALQPAGAAGVNERAGSVPTKEIDDQINAATGDLEEASKVVNDLKNELTAVQEKLSVAQTKLANANASVSQAQGAAAAAQAKLDAATVSVAKANAEVAVIRTQIEVLNGQIALLARTVYISGGRFEELQILIESKNPAEIAERLAALKRVSRGNTVVRDEMAAAQVALAAKLEELRHFRDVAEASQADATAELDKAATSQQEAQSAQGEVAEIVAKQQALLQVAATHKHEVKAMYDQLLAEQRHIAAVAKARAEQEARQEAARLKAAADAAKKGKPPAVSPPAGTPSVGTPDASGPGTLPTGGLIWPIPGHSAGGRTGWRVHPVYGYRSCHTGDDIGAGSGTPILAAASGTVVLAESGGPYGNHTLISHGGGLATMYAHQSRFAVSAGAKVSQGDVIGYVGSTGYSTGPHLHFEVHVNGIPYEPMGWFGQSKHPVDCWSG